MTKKLKPFGSDPNVGVEKYHSPVGIFKWPKRKVKALGVWLSVEPEATRTLNYDEKLEDGSEYSKLLEIPKTYSDWQNSGP